jgi:hypothetical protein
VVSAERRGTLKKARWEYRGLLHAMDAGLVCYTLNAGAGPLLGTACAVAGWAAGRVSQSTLRAYA